MAASETHGGTFGYENREEKKEETKGIWWDTLSSTLRTESNKQTCPGIDVETCLDQSEL